METSNVVTEEMKTYIQKSVLCWLATSNAKNVPNVSPKEMFTLFEDSTLLIANIASPNSVQNIEMNSSVCVSILDVFIQKGFKIKGVAKIIEKTDGDFAKKQKVLTDLYSDQFPIQSIIEVEMKQVDKIIAPSYFLYPETTEESQIENAMKTYKVRPLDK